MIQSDTDLLRAAFNILLSFNIQVTNLCTQTIDASNEYNLPLCYHSNTSTDNMNFNNNNYTNTSTDNFRNDLFNNTTSSSTHYQRLLQEQVQHIGSTVTSDSSSLSQLLETDAFVLYNIIGTIFLIGGVALISCLYLGLLTLDVIDLEIIQRVSIEQDEIMYATNLLPIIKQRHRLLTTLLVLNTCTMETLPIFLNNIVPEWGAIIISTTLILLFGEIIPSAVAVGPNQLYLANKLSSLTLFFMWLLTPITTPLVLLLDYIVHGSTDNNEHNKDSNGHHTADIVYNRNELAALVRIQHESRMAAAARNNKSVSLVKHQHEFKEKKRDESWNAIKKEIMERVNTRLDIISERNAHIQQLEHRNRTAIILNNKKNKFNKNNSGVNNNSNSNINNNDIAYDSQPTEPAIEQLNPPLHPKEVDLITGALQMKTRLVMDEYTPLRKVYALPDTLILNLYTVAGIYAKGYSRIPVYEINDNDPDDKTSIKGFFLIRQLILIDWDHERLISTLPLQRPDCISPRMNLVDCMELLRTGGTLMAFVCAVPEIANRALENEQSIPKEAGFMGIITLEDVMESVLQGRIHDEWDVKDRDRAIATLHRWAATKLQTMYRKKRSIQVARQLRSGGSFNGGGSTTSSVCAPFSPSKDMYSNNNHSYDNNGQDQEDNYGYDDFYETQSAPTSRTRNTSWENISSGNNKTVTTDPTSSSLINTNLFVPNIIVDNGDASSVTSYNNNNGNNCNNNYIPMYGSTTATRTTVSSTSSTTPVRNNNYRSFLQNNSTTIDIMDNDEFGEVNITESSSLLNSATTTTTTIGNV